MPVTKTAKRALRASKRKEQMNKKFISKLENALRKAQKKPSKKSVLEAISLVDKAAKKNIIHKNKAARLKSRLDQIEPQKSSKKQKKASKK